MNIALCDDEPDAVADMGERVERFFRGNANVRCFSAGDELIRGMGESPADIILLDIKMAGRDGMETARLLRQRGFYGDIIFVTVLPELVYDSFSVEARDYIVKPVDDRRLFGALERCVKRRQKRYITVGTEEGEVAIPLEEIIYAEVLDKRVLLHETAVATAFRGSISETEKKLGADFFRCHRSYLVNLRHIRRVDRRDVVMKNGGKVPLSRLRRSELLKTLAEYMGEELL
ncbi:MAG: LytTR family DNA-binding domain-containing protein [Ruminococcus sp.]|nr:LytTR family DNA-binding domain-containing protein [Ruminococcus sp.]